MSETKLEDIDGKTALKRMILLRMFEEHTGNLFADGEIPGFVHLYIGEEAVAVGATSALKSGDTITSTHRGHGHCLAMGLEPKRMMAELYGNREGYCNGKGGSMHIANLDSGMLGANGIVGAGAPQATGAALAEQVRGDEQVSLAFFGDGGMAQGQVHESLNLAAAWGLPVIYVVEKNQYAEMMDIEKIYGNTDFHDAGGTYDIPGVQVDGMDVEEVYRAVREARHRAIEGEGPTLVVAETYRFQPHAEGLMQLRTEDEEDVWKEKDPIKLMKDRLTEADKLTDEEYEEIVEDVNATLEEAISFARNGTRPGPSEAYDDIYNETAPDVEYHLSNMEKL